MNKKIRHLKPTGFTKTKHIYNLNKWAKLLIYYVFAISDANKPTADVRILPTQKIP